MAAEVGKQMIRVPGNWAHMPPEAFHTEPIYTTKLDVFSFGCVVIHTITHNFPSPDPSPVPCIGWSEIDRRSKHFKNMECCPDMYCISQICLQDNPLQRPDAHELCILLKDSAKLKTYFGNFYPPCSRNFMFEKLQVVYHFDLAASQIMFSPLTLQERKITNLEIGQLDPVKAMLMLPKELQGKQIYSKLWDELSVGSILNSYHRTQDKNQLQKFSGVMDHFNGLQQNMHPASYLHSVTFSQLNPHHWLQDNPSKRPDTNQLYVVLKISRTSSQITTLKLKTLIEKLYLPWNKDCKLNNHPSHLSPKPHQQNIISNANFLRIYAHHYSELLYQMLTISNGCENLSGGWFNKINCIKPLHILVSECNPRWIYNCQTVFHKAYQYILESDLVRTGMMIWLDNSNLLLLYSLAVKYRTLQKWEKSVVLFSCSVLILALFYNGNCKNLSIEFAGEDFWVKFLKHCIQNYFSPSLQDEVYIFQLLYKIIAKIRMVAFTSLGARKLSRSVFISVHASCLTFYTDNFGPVSYSTVVLYVGIMKVWDFYPHCITQKPA